MIPRVTVDIVIEVGNGIVLIKRKNTPHGQALPGGFVDDGESLEMAAVRDAKEETTLKVHLTDQLHTYSNPERDPHHHTISTVFIAQASGSPRGRANARKARIFTEGALPSPIVFDHTRIMKDYFDYKRTGKSPPVRIEPRKPTGHGQILTVL